MNLHPRTEEKLDLLNKIAERDRQNGVLARNLALAKSAFEEIVEFGRRAHADGSSQSHSFHLGLAAGTASRVLAKLEDDEVKK